MFSVTVEETCQRAALITAIVQLSVFVSLLVCSLFISLAAALAQTNSAINGSQIKRILIILVNSVSTVSALDASKLSIVQK